MYSRHPKRHKVLPKLFLPIFSFLLIAGGITLVYLQKDRWTGDLTITEHVLSYPTPVVRETDNVNKTGAFVTKTWPIEWTANQAASVTVVVNKKHKLPADYVPAGLTAIDNGSLRLAAAQAYKAFVKDAALKGFSIYNASAYRSYATQASLYNNYVAVDGVALADTYSARPGHSEHQTGLTVDVGEKSSGCLFLTCFGYTRVGKWIAANAADYGFIVRYPEGKESVTGYQYEPWHLRYVGVSAAKSIVKSGLTMDEYFGMTAGDY